jgi:hypothetical protein
VVQAQSAHRCRRSVLEAQRGRSDLMQARCSVFHENTSMMKRKWRRGKEPNVSTGRLFETLASKDTLHLNLADLKNFQFTRRRGLDVLIRSIGADTVTCSRVDQGRREVRSRSKWRTIIRFCQTGGIVTQNSLLSCSLNARGLLDAKYGVGHAPTIMEYRKTDGLER